MPPTDTNTSTQSATNAGPPAKDVPGTSGSASDAGTPPVDLGASYGSHRVDIEHEARGQSPYAPPSGQSNQSGSGGKPQNVDELKRQAKQASDRTSEQAHEAYEQVQKFTNAALENAKQQWRQSSGQARQRAEQLATEQKDRAARGIDDAVRAAHAAADTLEERNDKTVAEYARTAARSLEHVRDYVQHARFEDLRQDATRFTRRHPEWVLGGAFIGGLAIARFLKADRPGSRSTGRPGQADPGVYGDVYRSQDEPTSSAPRATAPDVPVATANPGTDPVAAQAGLAPDAPVGLNNPAGHEELSPIDETPDLTASPASAPTPGPDTRNAAPDEGSGQSRADTGEKGGVV